MRVVAIQCVERLLMLASIEGEICSNYTVNGIESIVRDQLEVVLTYHKVFAYQT